MERISHLLHYFSNFRIKFYKVQEQFTTTDTSFKTILLFLFFLGAETPIFFILSPGVNPLKDVETLGKTLGYTSADKNFHIVSLGQGQEVVAESAMNRGAKEG